MLTTYTVLDEFDERPIRVFVDREKAAAYAAGRKVVVSRSTRRKRYDSMLQTLRSVAGTDEALF